MTVSLRQLFISRFSLWLILAVAGGYFVYNLNNYIKYGIDLVGGTYVTLQVQLDKAHETELVERMQDAADVLKKAGKTLPKSKKIEAGIAQLVFDDVKDANIAFEVLSSAIKGVSVDRKETIVTLTLTSETKARIDREAVDSNINALEMRVNAFGVGETLVAKHGTDKIIVELPNIHNTQQAKAMIGRAALLEIKLVEDDSPSEQDLLNRYGGSAPEGFVVVPEHRGDRQHFYLVPAYSDLTGRLLKSAHSSLGGDTGVEPVVNFEFKKEGAAKFYELTANNIDRQLAIVLDGEVKCAPKVHTALSSSGMISGAFTASEAQELAMLLRAGSFVAPVTFEEERNIGATLGQESIRKGLMACIIGMLLLLGFIVITYKMAGLLGYIILLFNLLFSLVLLAGMQATLTLPGIAGLLLTIGMAIDASILIFERMRDELAAGIPLRRAIELGFSGAMTVILDSNITSLLMAIVLYKFGTGPIQGFAATQIVGIIATLVTALWMQRSFFTFATDVLGVTKMRI